MATVQTPTNPVNESHKTYRQPRVTFPTSYRHLTTELYGLINPFFVMEGVEGDTIPLNSHEELRTHTLSAPMMSKVTKSKDYYAVPMRAILPNTWEQIYANPTQGDDIPEDSNCLFPIRDLVNHLSAQFISNYVANDAAPTIGETEIYMKMLLLAEAIFSNGSLLAKMGCHLSPLFVYYDLDSDGVIIRQNPRDFDYWFDNVYVPWLKRLNPAIRIGTTVYMIQFEGQPVTQTNITYVTMRRFMQLCREHMDFDVTSVNPFADDTPLLGELFGNAIQYEITIPGSTYDDENNTVYETINIQRLLAYQLVCFHFYTNDKIDSIYSAQLYRGMMQTLSGCAFGGRSTPQATDINSVRKYYTYNGELLEYDHFSLAVQQALLESVGIQASKITSVESWKQTRYPYYYEYLYNIFGYQNSLRYGDYFTGSRPSPLAVGDVNTTVVGDEVNAVDLTRSLLMQRFLNSVNRVGRKFDKYIKMLSGKLPAPDPTNPTFLAHIVNELGKFEVENTAENQGNIVTIMRDGQSRYVFTYEASEPCIVLGISWYEVARIYSKTVDRQFFHKTRFDMFNKFFQYQGDQAIYRKELNARWLLAPDTNFAYTLRYMEYKQRISIATGGFVSNLPAYAFITDNGSTGEFLGDDSNISPEYIRSRPSEFDRFYSSLTGVSLGSYFHFIVSYINDCPAERPMEYAPSVL